MTRRLPLSAAGVVAFLAAIVAANVLTAHYGMVPVGFGLVATAGTYLAGLMFVLRDALDDLAGLWVVVLTIAAAALVSALVSSPQLALASAVAVLLSESADLAVYAPLRDRGYVRAAIASNIVGAFCDSVVFLALAGFPIGTALPGQMLAKVTVTAVVVAAVVIARALPGQPMCPRGGSSHA